MNMDISIYKTFTIYSVLELFICLEFAMILDKLYYEEKNTLANKYSIILHSLKITMIYFGFEIINFIIYPIYRIKTCYLQLEWSALKTTSNKICASILRMFMSFLKTPFCTGIGQVCSSIYQFITLNIFFYKKFTF